MTRFFISTLLLLTSLTAFARKNPVEPAPRWMTEGDQLRLDLIEALSESGDCSRALSIVTILRAEDKKLPELDLFQGICLRDQGLRNEAEALLIRAKRAMARDVRPTVALCVLYADAAEIDQALSECKRATTIDDRSASAWNNYGFLLLTADRSEEAQTALERSVKLDSTVDLYRNNLGLAQAANGKTNSAVRTLSSVLPPADANYNVGAALERAGVPADARSFYDRALNLEPTHSQALEAIARLDEKPTEKP